MKPTLPLSTGTLSFPASHLCPLCNSITYTWGDPLPGQYRPPPGESDTRERAHRSCINCNYTTPPP